eukprot:gnl/Carplike_NY0171/4481_a6084_342.p1 GENE.gnl/Carplike_NY0171/4481_a6084_342~~gnl/Carplike_NY0171/4481_a6084_342.p1  ORF type:complete len:300 (-),score=25.59 gnl/Carplike_NY0171/4481_a6084_342:21-920(-)
MTTIDRYGFCVSDLRMFDAEIEKQYEAWGVTKNSIREVPSSSKRLSSSSPHGFPALWMTPVGNQPIIVQVIGGEFTCTCGISVMSGYPCCHMIHAAKVRGMKIGISNFHPTLRKSSARHTLESIGIISDHTYGISHNPFHFHDDRSLSLTLSLTPDLPSSQQPNSPSSIRSGVDTLASFTKEVAMRKIADLYESHKIKELSEIIRLLIGKTKYLFSPTELISIYQFLDATASYKSQVHSFETDPINPPSLMSHHQPSSDSGLAEHGISIMEGSQSPRLSYCHSPPKLLAFSGKKRGRKK